MRNQALLIKVVRCIVFTLLLFAANNVLQYSFKLSCRCIHRHINYYALWIYPCLTFWKHSRAMTVTTMVFRLLLFCHLSFYLEAFHISRSQYFPIRMRAVCSFLNSGFFAVCLSRPMLSHVNLTIVYSVVKCSSFHWLSRVSILLLTRDIDIVILSVRPSVRLSVCLSVCLSVTRWYCMKTA